MSGVRATRRTGCRGLAALALLAWPLVGCVGTDGPSSTAPGTAPAASTPARTTAAGSRSSSPATTSSSRPTAGASTVRTDLRDGRHPARVVAVDAARRTITVDVVQIFFGVEASKAARQDGATEVPPPDDYWIRNTNPRTRRLPVAARARVTVNVHGASRSGSATEDVLLTLAELARVPHLADGIFWLTLRDGVVTRIAEQYLP